MVNPTSVIPLRISVFSQSNRIFKRNEGRKKMTTLPITIVSTLSTKFIEVQTNMSDKARGKFFEEIVADIIEAHEDDPKKNLAPIIIETALDKKLSELN